MLPRARKRRRQRSLLVPGLYHQELVPPSPIKEFKTQQFLSVPGIFLGLLIAVSNGDLAGVGVCFLLSGTGPGDQPQLEVVGGSGLVKSLLESVFNWTAQDRPVSPGHPSLI